jgi:NAD(P)-dependent dehydrogenase (short-subunit alcohol dehydrogenase family)
MAARADAEFGRIDVLVNNAGLWRGLGEAGLHQSDLRASPVGCSRE